MTCQKSISSQIPLIIPQINPTKINSINKIQCYIKQKLYKTKKMKMKTNNTKQKK